MSIFKNDIYFQNNSIPTVIIDSDYNFIDINKNGCIVLAFKRYSFISHNMRDFFKNSEESISVDLLDSLFKGEIQYYKSEKNFINGVGKPLSGLFTMSLILDEINNKKYVSIAFQENETKDIEVLKNQLGDLDVVLKKSPIVQYVMDHKTGERIYENKNFLESLGYNKNDWSELGEYHFLLNLLDSKNLKNFNSAFKNLIEKKDPKVFYETEYFLLNKKGEKVWLNSKAIPLRFDVKGEVHFSYGMIEDITNQKNSENEITSQKKLLQKISDLIPQFIYVSDISKDFLFKNNQCKEVLGYSNEEYFEMDYTESTHKDFHDDCIKLYTKAYNSTSVDIFELELKMKHKTKGFRWYKHQIIIFERGRNKKPSALLKTIEDIHDSKIFKLKLAEQEKFVKNVTSGLPITVYVFDKINREIIFSNTDEHNVLGYTDVEFSNLKLSQIHPDSLDQAQNNINKLKNKIDKEFIASEIQIKHKTLGFRWYKVKTKVFKRNDKKNVLQILETIEDIHDQKKDSLKIMNQKKFINNISNSIPQYLFVFNLLTNKCIYTNFENKLIFGYERDEFLDIKYDIILPSHIEKVKKFVDNFLKSIKGDEYSIDFPILFKTKSYRWVKLKVIITDRDDRNKPIQILETLEDINKNKRNFIKIKDQQNFIQKVASIFPHLILITELKKDSIIYSNFDGRKFIGYSESEWIKKGRSIIHPKSRKEYFSNLKDLLSKEVKEINIDIQLKSKKGEYLWITIRTKVFKYKNGKPTHIMSTFINVNNNKLSYEKIITQQAFIRQVTNSIPQFLSVWDINSSTKCIYTNFEDKQIFGYDRDDYIKNGQDYIHPKYRSLMGTMGRIITSTPDETEFCCEFKLFEKNLQKYIWVSLKIIVTKRDDRNQAIRTIEIVEDIDKSKRDFNKINEQQNLIKKVNGTIPSFVQVTDVKSRKVTYTNYDDRVFLGYKRKEWEKLGTELIIEDHYANYLKDLQKLVGNREKEIISHEIKIKNKKGIYKWVLFINTQFSFNLDGQASQIITIFRDINERKELYIKLENSQKELDNHILKLEEQLSKNIELERFASITSHDLKEPLRTILNYSQILSATNKDNLDDEGKELLEHIEIGTKRMSELIQDILTFSKIEQTGNVFKEVNLDSLLLKVKSDLSRLIIVNNTNLIIEKLPTIKADSTQLRQVFQNLISNAIKFSKPDSSKIEINAKKEDTMWVFSIKDYGIGIPKKELENIFGIFKKLHNRSQYEGQGIGLSICKRIVERHDGKIWVESNLNISTTFYFSIPI